MLRMCFHTGLVRIGFGSRRIEAAGPVRNCITRDHSRGVLQAKSGGYRRVAIRTKRFRSEGPGSHGHAGVFQRRTLAQPEEILKYPIVLYLYD